MGHIEYLEIFNFKSYKGKQRIGPFKKFTCIVGPNGAGKSNLMDAISFVLGVRTAHLRSQQLKELIYKIDDNDTNHNRSASVLLHFNPSDGEGSLNFERSISPAGVGRYRVNGKEVTWEKYDETLKKQNILVRARNFLVFQGDVEKVASQSPKDLISMFEQISGSEALRAKFEELRVKKLQNDEAVKANNITKKGIQVEFKQYQEMEKEAKVFAQLVEERKQVKLERLLLTLFHIERQTEDRRRVLNENKEKLKESEAKAKTAAKKAEESNAHWASAHRQFTKLDQSLKKEIKSADKLRPEEARLREQLRGLTTRLERDSKKLKDKQAERSKKEKDLKELEKELEHATAEKETFEEEAKKAEGGVEMDATLLQEYNELKQVAGKKSGAQKSSLDKLQTEQATDEEAISHRFARIDEITERRKQIADELTKLLVRENEDKENLKSAQSELQSLKKQYNEITTNAQSLLSRRESLLEEHNKVRSRLGELKADQRESAREELFNRAVEELMRHFSGVKGKLHVLCKTTERKYNLAVTVAMGKNFNAIVCDTAKTVQQCIKYLKEQRLCTAVFIPLDNIVAKPLDDSLRSLPVPATPLIDVVRFDSSLENALLYALGSSSVVCSDLKTARKLCYGTQMGHKIKAVTLDGTVIAKNGNMTGGKVDSDFMVKAKKWDQSEVEGLRRKRDELGRELEEIDDHLGGIGKAQVSQKEEVLKERIGLCEGNIQSLDVNLLYCKDKRGKLQAEDNSLKKEEQQLTKEVNALKKTVSVRDKEIVKVQAELNKIEQTIFKGFSEKVGVQNIREYEDMQLKAQAERSKRRLELSDRESKLDSQAAYARSNLKRVDNEVKILDKSIREYEAGLEKLDKEIKAMGVKRKEMDERRQELVQKADKFRAAMEEAENAGNQHKKVAARLNEIVGNMQKEIAVMEAEVEGLRATFDSHIETAQIEEIQIPRTKRKRATPDARKAKKKKRGSSLSDSDAEMGETSDTGDDPNVSESNIDYSSLSEDLRLLSGDEIAQASNDLEGKEREIISKIDTLAPNLKAMERMQEVNKELKVLGKKLDEVRAAAHEVTNEYAKIRDKRRDLFLKAYNHVAANIEDTYKQLTESEAHPVGGSAYLDLESEDDPFGSGMRYNVMPPMKRFREIDQLSGGEKTVAALALLFAVHSYQPSPFFVLDEVDAALDNENVHKVAAYICSRSEDFQTIVISLKDMFFEHADALIGIYRDVDEQCSKSLTFDLTEFTS